MLKIKFGKQATKIEAWGLLQLGVYKNLANLLGTAEAWLKKDWREEKEDAAAADDDFCFKMWLHI